VPEEEKKAERASPSGIRYAYGPRKLLGVDVAQIPGLEENALQLFREVRPRRVQVDRRRALVPWLALCPDNNISDGKLLWRGIRRVKTAPVISFA